MIIRKHPNLDMVPAIFYSGIFSGIYGLFLASSFTFSSNDILMGFFTQQVDTSYKKILQHLNQFRQLDLLIYVVY